MHQVAERGERAAHVAVHGAVVERQQPRHVLEDDHGRRVRAQQPHRLVEELSPCQRWYHSHADKAKEKAKEQASARKRTLQDIGDHIEQEVEKKLRCEYIEAMHDVAQLTPGQLQQTREFLLSLKRKRGDNGD